MTTHTTRSCLSHAAAGRRSAAARAGTGWRPLALGWAAALIGAAGLAPAGAQVTVTAPAASQAPLSAGLWNLWRTPSASLPTTAPDLTICVDAAGARDPALLMGEAPGDASCRVRSTRRTDALGLELMLTCPGNRVLKASVRLASVESFVTRLEPGSANTREPVSFVHARREGGCTR